MVLFINKSQPNPCSSGYCNSNIEQNSVYQSTTVGYSNQNSNNYTCNCYQGFAGKNCDQIDNTW